MQKSQSFRLITVCLSLFLRQELPSPAQLFGDLCIVFVWRHRDDLPPLNLGPDHEGVHRPLDVIQLVFLGL